MPDRNVDLLIMAIEAPIAGKNEQCGNPYLFRKIAVDELMRTAKESDSRKTLEEIAVAFSKNGFRKELSEVRARLERMQPAHDEQKRMPISRPPAREPTGPQKLLLK